MPRLGLVAGVVLTIGWVALEGCRRDAPPDYGQASWAAYPAYPGYPAYPAAPAPAPAAVGKASYYADSLAGNATASGEPYDPGALTAAHPELPFGTIVDVTRVDTRTTVRVRVNDRGPFGRSERIIDLSRHAAESLDMMRAGVIDVELRIVWMP